MLLTALVGLPRLRHLGIGSIIWDTLSDGALLAAALSEMRQLTQLEMTAFMHVDFRHSRPGNVFTGRKGACVDAIEEYIRAAAPWVTPKVSGWYAVPWPHLNVQRHVHSDYACR